MAYEWDESKRLSNLAKHEIDFTQMERFDWDNAAFEFDDDYPEPRWTATGYIGLVVCYVIYEIREDNYRIISLRKATAREIREYAES